MQLRWIAATLVSAALFIAGAPAQADSEFAEGDGFTVNEFTLKVEAQQAEFEIIDAPGAVAFVTPSRSVDAYPHLRITAEALVNKVHGFDEYTAPNYQIGHAGFQQGGEYDCYFLVRTEEPGDGQLASATDAKKDDYAYSATTGVRYDCQDGSPAASAGYYTVAISLRPYLTNPTVGVPNVHWSNILDISFCPSESEQLRFACVHYSNPRTKLVGSGAASGGGGPSVMDTIDGNCIGTMCAVLPADYLTLNPTNTPIVLAEKPFFSPVSEGDPGN